MKISDEELLQAINKEHCDAIARYLAHDQRHHQIVESALQELQQLREERRWRDISELNEASAPQFFQVRDKANVNPMPFWLMDGILCTWAEDQDGIGDVSIEMAQEWYTHWRPLPMDLPEVEP